MPAPNYAHRRQFPCSRQRFLSRRIISVIEVGDNCPPPHTSQWKTSPSRFPVFKRNSPHEIDSSSSVRWRFLCRSTTSRRRAAKVTAFPEPRSSVVSAYSWRSRHVHRVKYLQFSNNGCCSFLHSSLLFTLCMSKSSDQDGHAGC